MGRRAIVIGAVVLVVALFIILNQGAGGDGANGGGAGNGGGGGSGEGQTFSGVGKVDTDPFQLEGGDYIVKWSVESDGPCRFDSRLRSTTNQLVSQQTGRMFNVSGRKTERTSRVNRVAPGEYYIQVTGSCRWTMTLTRNEA